MRPLILVSIVPDAQITRLSLEVFDSNGEQGEKCMYRFMFDSARRPESRPDWAAVHACRLIRELLGRLEQELDRDGESMRRPGMIRQTTIARAARWMTSPGETPIS